jgi:hypothetical protein
MLVPIYLGGGAEKEHSQVHDKIVLPEDVRQRPRENRWGSRFEGHS